MTLRSDVTELLRRVGVGRRCVDDPFFNDKPPPRLGVYDLDEESLCHEVVPTACVVPGCRFASQSLLEYEAHYNAAHRYTCALCRRLLPSPHLLDLHLQETHDSFFAVMSAKKPSYSCYTEECKEKFMNAEERFDHCVKLHRLPKDFRFEHVTSKNTKSKKKKAKPKTENMEISEQPSNSKETSNQDADCTLEPVSKAPKNFSFGHNKNKGFPKYNGNKLTGGTKVQRDIDMDVIITDLKESLPE